MFESALLLVGTKMRSPSCRTPAPQPMLRPCSFHALRMTLSKPCSFSRPSCNFKEYVQVCQKGVHDECLTDPQRGSEQCQRMPSGRVHSDRFIEHCEMRLSRFSTDAQPGPAMQSRINTKEAGTGLLATQVANKRVSLN